VTLALSRRINFGDWTSPRLRGGMTAVVALFAFAGVLALAGSDPNALCLLPLLALAWPLLLRRYPGERMLAGLAARPRSRWPRPHALLSRLERVLTVAPHGGQLIARSLAVRPPPALIPAS
jgi:hypothetical protein